MLILFNTIIVLLEEKNVMQSKKWLLSNNIEEKKEKKPYIQRVLKILMICVNKWKKNESESQVERTLFLKRSVLYVYSTLLDLQAFVCGVV